MVALANRAGEPLWSATRALVRQVLEHPLAGGREWTVQGFGFLRTYLDRDKRWRLNVWDHSLKREGVSTIHDHPWGFTSYILTGALFNTIYTETQDPMAEQFSYALIRCGPLQPGQAPMTDQKGVCRLKAWPTTAHYTGDVYQQTMTQIHRTDYVDGTVSLNDRDRRGDYARVFWPLGQEWVTAEPFAATAVHVLRACDAAVNRMKAPMP